MELNFKGSKKDDDNESERFYYTEYPLFEVLGAELIKDDLWKLAGHLVIDESKVISIHIRSNIKVPWGGRLVIKDGNMYHACPDWSACFVHPGYGTPSPKYYRIGEKVIYVKDNEL
jgi:hypothetical protein